MENNARSMETLLQKIAEYGETTCELLKLKTLDKTSDIVSSFLPGAIAILVFMSFMLFLSLGMALWIGEILHRIFYGFFVVAAFYGVIAIVLYLFFRKWLKKLFGDYIVKNMSK
jgi:ABC-type uncharacterized transport system fused permease/ATPase subunit